MPERRANGYSSRGDTPRRRAAADRSGTPLRLEAPITGKEDDELESEFLQLKVSYIIVMVIANADIWLTGSYFE